MTAVRPRFSICIPAYNRARFLPVLLESVAAQDFKDFEIVICEDKSPERAQIAAAVSEFTLVLPGLVRYIENEENLGYDGNIRELVAQSRGEYCFFLGNDDLMCVGALSHLDACVNRHPGVGMVLRSYAWFYTDPTHPAETIRYFSEETEFAAGATAIRVCFRRSGVISGYIIDRDMAEAAATAEFDGSLYYQMHLTASVLSQRKAVFTPEVLVLCRNTEPPDFGHSQSEKGRYTPGQYTPEARFNMIRGAVSIITRMREIGGLDVVEPVMRDYGNYFYAYIKDQLDLPIRRLYALYRSFGRLGFDRYPMFHVYFAVGAMLGEKNLDRIVHLVRVKLKRTPRFGI